MKSVNDVGRMPLEGEWRPSQAPPRERLGCELKSMFENLTSGPMPEHLLQLADALEDAFQRGELFEPRAGLDS